MALPLAALAVVLLARHRARAGHPAPVRTALADIGVPIGTAPWIWMILTPSNRPSTISPIPLHELLAMSLGPWQTTFVQVGGNLLVFAALGALLPLRSPRFASLPRVALLAALASLTVEALQYGLRLGRVSSIDDILVNTAGAVLAALITRRWWSRSIPGGTVPR
ncbi:VanZ family protein [Nonomuraea sp. NBC_01738]|uniref:VanZ family protein n=1 Tax=Nonomuraea sp. NBC_01738 TaxID=2976003 RepID=UPI002E10BF65|nr:VanZ family protein [Nonomuraea sp. NBC_01738]